MKKRFIISTLCLLTWTSLVFAHGVKVTMEKKTPFILIGAAYHGGKALGNADVTVRLDTDEAVFQTGSTDKNGNFCFYPDRPGKWTVTVDDGMGHRGKTEITLDDGFFNPPPEPTTPAAPTETTVTGTSVEPAAQAEPVKEEKVPPSQNDMCCYLLKIVLGVVLILAITLIMHRLKKKMEK